MVCVTVLTSEKTGKAGFAELLWCTREKTSLEVGGRFKGNLFGAVLLKPFDSEPL